MRNIDAFIKSTVCWVADALKSIHLLLFGLKFKISHMQSSIFTSNTQKVGWRNIAILSFISRSRSGSGSKFRPWPTYRFWLNPQPRPELWFPLKMTSIRTDLFQDLSYGSTCTCCSGRFCPRWWCGPYGCQVSRCLCALCIFFRVIEPEPAMRVACPQAHQTEEAQPKPELRHHVHFQSFSNSNRILTCPQ